MAKKKSPKTTTSPKMAFPPFEVPKGPTGIRPLTADRLRAYEKARKAYQERSRANNRLKTPSTTPSPPVKTTSPNDMQYRHHTISPQGNSSLEPKVPKTTNTFMYVPQEQRESLRAATWAGRGNITPAWMAWQGSIKQPPPQLFPTPREKLPF